MQMYLKGQFKNVIESPCEKKSSMSCIFSFLVALDNLLFCCVCVFVQKRYSFIL